VYSFLATFCSSCWPAVLLVFISANNGKVIHFTTVDIFLAFCRIRTIMGYAFPHEKRLQLFFVSVQLEPEIILFASATVVSLDSKGLLMKWASTPKWDSPLR